MAFEQKKKPGDGLIPEDKPSSVILQPGYEYTLTPDNCKRGMAGERYWMFVIDKAKKGYNKMQIWLRNAEDCYSADKIKVTEIVKVELETKMFDNKYFQNFKAIVRAEPMQTDKKTEAEGGFMAFEETLNADAEELPFM